MNNNEEEVTEEINTDCFELEDFDDDLDDYLPEVDHLFED